MWEGGRVRSRNRLDARSLYKRLRRGRSQLVKAAMTSKRLWSARTLVDGHETTAVQLSVVQGLRWSEAGGFRGLRRWADAGWAGTTRGLRLPGGCRDRTRGRGRRCRNGSMSAGGPV